MSNRQAPALQHHTSALHGRLKSEYYTKKSYIRSRDERNGSWKSVVGSSKKDKHQQVIQVLWHSMIKEDNTKAVLEREKARLQEMSVEDLDSMVKELYASGTDATTCATVAPAPSTSPPATAVAKHVRAEAVDDYDAMFGDVSENSDCWKSDSSSSESD